MLRKISFILFSAIFILSLNLKSVYSETHVYSDITTLGVVWDLDGSPYFIEPNDPGNHDLYAISIWDDASLTIEEGVYVVFKRSIGVYSLIVEDGGRLEADVVTFEPDCFTGGNYDNWNGIIFKDGSLGHIVNCEIEYSNYGIEVYCDNPIPVIQNNYFDYCQIALYFNGCNDPSDLHAVKYNVINHVDEKAIICESSILQFEDNLICEFEDTGQLTRFGFYLDESPVIIIGGGDPNSSDFDPGNTIYHNHLDYAIYCLNCAPEIKDCCFKDVPSSVHLINTAIACFDEGNAYSADIHDNYFWYGANIELYNHSSPTIYDNIFQEGYCPGGWASPLNTWISLINQSTAVIYNNSFWKPAGAIYTQSTSLTPAIIENNIFFAGVNYAAYGVHAITIYNDDSQVGIYNNDFYHLRDQGNDSFCIYLSDNDPGTNCKIYNNTFTDCEANVIMIESGPTYDIDAKNNNYYEIQGYNYCSNQLEEILDIGEEDAMSTDPLFVDPNISNPFLYSPFLINYDFRLTYTSELINAGYDVDDLNDPDGSRNDVGAYGGPYSMLPHYVLIPYDATNFNLTLPIATYRVSCDIEVGVTFTIQGGSKLQFDTDKGITVNNSGTLIASGRPGDIIEMVSYPGEGYWDGICLEFGSLSNSRLKYIDIDNCHEGIRLENVNLTNAIEHCNFTNINDCGWSNGIYQYGSDTDVKYCNFSNCKTAIELYESDAEIIENNITVDDYGIYIMGGSTFRLEGNHIDNYQEYNTGICMNGAGGQMIEDTISQVDCGLRLINSDPKMKGNIIDACNDEGMYLSAGSQPVMYFPSFNAENRIADCGGYEIYISGHLYPLIKEGHNDLIDNTSQDYIIYSYFEYQPTYSYDVGGNFWDIYSTNGIRNRIYPPNIGNYYISVDYYDDNSNTNYGIESLQQDLLAEALEFEMNGQYAEAYDAYADIVADYPDDPVAITAFTRMFYCVDVLEWDFDDLHDYYQQLEVTISNENNLFYLQRMQGRALRKTESFEDVLDLYEGILTNVSNLTDSVFVLIDIENTLFEMSLTGPGLCSMGDYSDPATAGYNLRKKVNELLTILEDAQDSYGPDGETAMVNFKLLSNYPNPFNATTRIFYNVPEVSEINLTVYSVSGQEVCTLVEGIKYAGEFNVDWDAGKLASGVYFVKISVVPMNGDSPLTAVNKTLLIK